MNREIGAVGTAACIVGGVIAIALPAAVDGIGWWDVGVALVALSLAALTAAALVTAIYERYRLEALARRDEICSAPACCTWGGAIAAAVGLAALTPASSVALWVWLGASLLVAAARGYGGCEVLAFPNLIRSQGADRMHGLRPDRRGGEGHDRLDETAVADRRADCIGRAHPALQAVAACQRPNIVTGGREARTKLSIPAGLWQTVLFAPAREVGNVLGRSK